MTDELPNVRTLTSNVLKNTVRYAECVRISKNRCYESPYAVTGGIKHTGSEEAPKDIKMIRLSERGKLTTVMLNGVVAGCTVHDEKGSDSYNKRVYVSESSAMVPAKR